MWFLTFAGAAALYLATAQRTVGWQDSGMFQWRVLRGDLAGDLGLALAHPLYILAGRLLAAVSREHLPLLLNCFSGLGMAVALANLAAVAALLTQKRWIGLLVAWMLAVAHTPWWLSTVAEVYSWGLAGLTAQLWLLVALLGKPRWGVLAGLAFVSGLGLCIHNFALLPLPVYLVAAVVLIARRKLPRWSLAAAAAAYLAGVALYFGLTVELAVRSGDWLGAVGSAMFGKYSRQVLNFTAVSKHWKANAALSAMNFLNVLLPLAVIGWINMPRRLGRTTAAAIGAITLIQILFFVRYPVPDQFTFILPSLAMLAVAAAVGLAVLAELSRGLRIAAIAACLLSLPCQPILYASAPSLVRRAHLQPKRARPLPFRDEVRYWLVPWKHNERSARQFAEAALKQAAPDGVIIADSTAVHPLMLVKELEDPAPGVAVQFRGRPLPAYDEDPQGLREALGNRPLYILAPTTRLGDARFDKPPGGVLYTVRWNKVGRQELSAGASH